MVYLPIQIITIKPLPTRVGSYNTRAPSVVSPPRGVITPAGFWRGQAAGGRGWQKARASWWWR